MAYSETLAENIRVLIHSMGMEIEEKKMFGGIAFMYKSKMAFGIIKDELMVRILTGNYEEMLQLPHTREMDFTGRTMKGLIYVTPEGLKTSIALKKWILKGIEYVDKEGLLKELTKQKNKNKNK